MWGMFGCVPSETKVDMMACSVARRFMVLFWCLSRDDGSLSSTTDLWGSTTVTEIDSLSSYFLDLGFYSIMLCLVVLWGTRKLWCDDHEGSAMIVMVYVLYVNFGIVFMNDLVWRMVIIFFYFFCLGDEYGLSFFLSFPCVIYGDWRLWLVYEMVKVIQRLVENESELLLWWSCCWVEMMWVLWY